MRSMPSDAKGPYSAVLGYIVVLLQTMFEGIVRRGAHYNNTDINKEYPSIYIYPSIEPSSL